MSSRCEIVLQIDLEDKLRELLEASMPALHVSFSSSDIIDSYRFSYVRMNMSLSSGVVMFSFNCQVTFQRRFQGQNLCMEHATRTIYAFNHFNSICMN